MNKFYLLINLLLLVKSLKAISGASNGITYAQKVYDSCKSNRECGNLKYSHCIGGQCRCKPNYETLTWRKCKGNLNATCDSDYECSYRPGVGCILNTCQLYNEFFVPSNEEKVKLYRATTTRSRCETDQHCSNLRYTTCISGECKCDHGYWIDHYLDICRPVTNQTCSVNSDCKEIGTKCFQDVCMLPTDFFVESNALNASFYSAKGIDDSCKLDHHCRDVANTYCKEGSCVCTSDSKQISNKCIKVFNVPCNDEDDCISYDTKCVLNRCVRWEDFFVPQNSHNVSIYAAKYPHDFCQSDDHCRNVENSYCLNGLCHCKHDYLHDEQSRSCKYGIKDCVDDSDCSVYKTNCLAGVCVYPDDFFTTDADNHNVYSAPDIYTYCRTNHHCRDLKNTWCHENLCHCLEGYQLHAQGCIRVINISCSSDSDCPGRGTNCFFNTCQWTKDAMLADNATLFRTSRVNDYCWKEIHCRNLENTRCKSSSCQCEAGYELVASKCIEKEPITCYNDSDCHERGTGCVFNTCKSQSKFFKTASTDDLQLYAAKNIYGACQTDHHCRNLSNTSCFRKTCNCLPGYEYASDTCRKAVNVSCSDDSDCLLPGTFCFINTCRYPEDFLASNDYNTTLYAAKRIGGFCETEHHCRGIEHSICLYRRCTCQDQYSFDDDTCSDHRILKRYAYELVEA